ncbi:MAG: hypothetical protein ACP5HM_08390 [Anaerolineae bacterium]
MHSTRSNAQQQFAAWLRGCHNADMIRRAEAVPLRRNMVTVLEYARDHKVVGTQSTGNMPLKHIREVTAHFVEPPVLDTTIGNRTYRLRTEFDVWPLYFLHILAEVGGMLNIAPGQRWRLTELGETFLQRDPLLQLYLLLSIWWYQTNWLVAYPFEGMGEALPRDFNVITLAHLRELPVGEFVPFEPFADELIEATGLTWTVPDPDVTRSALHGAISRMIIYILASFGALDKRMREAPLGKGTLKKLDAFKITSLGHCLLKGVAAMLKG